MAGMKGACMWKTRVPRKNRPLLACQAGAGRCTWRLPSGGAKAGWSWPKSVGSRARVAEAETECVRELPGVVHMCARGQWTCGYRNRETRIPGDACVDRKMEL